MVWYLVERTNLTTGEKSSYVTSGEDGPKIPLEDVKELFRAVVALKGKEQNARPVDVRIPEAPIQHESLPEQTSDLTNPWGEARPGEL